MFKQCNDSDERAIKMLISISKCKQILRFTSITFVPIIPEDIIITCSQWNQTMRLVQCRFTLRLGVGTVVFFVKKIKRNFSAEKVEISYRIKYGMLRLREFEENTSVGR